MDGAGDGTPVRHGTEPGSAAGLQRKDEISGAHLDPGQPLIWRRTVPLAPSFELRQGGAVFGELEAAFTSGTDATGECLGRALDFRADSSLLGGVRVETLRPGEERPGPGFRGLLFGWGRITTPHQEELRWRHAFSRVYDHLLIDAQGEELLRLRPAFLRFGRTETRVMLSPAGWARPDLADLLLLTWFLRAHTEARGRLIFSRARRRRDGPAEEGLLAP